MRFALLAFVLCSSSALAQSGDGCTSRCGDTMMSCTNRCDPTAAKCTERCIKSMDNCNARCATTGHAGGQPNEMPKKCLGVNGKPMPCPDPAHDKPKPVKNKNDGPDPGAKEWLKKQGAKG